MHVCRQIYRYEEYDEVKRQIRHETKQNGKIIGPRWLSGAVIKGVSTIRAKEGLFSLNFIRLLRVVITPSVTSESTGR